MIKREKLVPEICRFLGIVIKMYFDEYEPPHIHALYGEYMGSINIKTLKLDKGDLPYNAFNLVKKWLKLEGNQKKLLKMWETKKIKKLSPLE